MRHWLVAQILAHLAWLLQLDRNIAHSWFQAHWGLTLSGYSWHLEQEGKFWGRLWACKIDGIFLWLWNERDHCKAAFMNDLRAYPELLAFPELARHTEVALLYSKERVPL